MNQPAPTPVTELNHGDHNAHLLAAWKRESPYPYYWTRSTLTETPYRVEDFVREVWEKLTAVLAKHPALKGHRWDYSRPAQYYLAFETIDRAVRGTLHRQAPLEDTAQSLRHDLLCRVNAGCLLTSSPLSKLWGQGQKVLSDDKEHEFWVDRQIGTSRHDQQLFVTAAGGSLRREHDIADILALLKEAVPHLCSLETGDGKIVVLERELRKKLWELVSGKDCFTDEMRYKAVDIVMDAWSASDGVSLKDISVVEQEIERETFLASRTAHWAETDKKGIGEIMKAKYKTHPFGTREERLATLLELEWKDTAGVERARINFVEGKARDTIQHALGSILTLDSLTADQRLLLKRRLVALELQILMACGVYASKEKPMDEREAAARDLQYLQGVLKKVGQLMPLPWDEFPHFAYASLALYCQGQDATPRGLQGML
jgi:hypothetical protein